MVVSTQASCRLGDIAREATAPLWFQLYVQHDRGFTRDLVKRAEAAGYRALVVTVDAPVSGLRNREQRAGFGLPPEVEAANLRGLPPLPLQNGSSPSFIWFYVVAPPFRKTVFGVWMGMNIRGSWGNGLFSPSWQA